MLRNFAVLAASALVCAGCALDTTEEQGDYVTETVVVLGPDGQETVHVRELTHDEAAQEAALRQLARDVATEGGEVHTELAKDSTCAYSSLWLHDQQLLGGNRICFTGSAGLDVRRVDLRNYCRLRIGKECRLTWGEAVRSYQGGDFEGYFFAENLPEGYYRFYSFSPGQIELSVNYIAEGATHVSVGPLIE